MSHLPRPIVKGIARYAIRPLTHLPTRAKRAATEALARLAVLPKGVSVSVEEHGGVPGALVRPADHQGPPQVLYLHGGAYEWGSPRTHRPVLAALALSSGRSVFAPDYRLAPEHPAPAAHYDAISAYEALAAEAGGEVVVAGDSAGGGLSIALAVAARDRGLPMPVALALISPWVDLTMSGESIVANAASDIILPRGPTERSARAYAAVLGAEDPVCSPLRAELAGLPPILIHVGGGELFLSEGEELARRAQAAGVEVTLRVFAGLWHDFQSAHAGMLAEADESLAEIGAFLSERLANRAPRARS